MGGGGGHLELDSTGSYVYGGAGGSIIMDPGSPEYQRHIMSMANRVLARTPGTGLCIDRQDWVGVLNIERSDPRTWFETPMSPEGRAVMPMVFAWKETMALLSNLFHSRPNQPLLFNPGTYRLDMLEFTDGMFAEYGDSNHMTVICGLANVARPVVMWLHPGANGKPGPALLNSTATADPYFQQLLHFGLWPALPVKYNDHMVLPSPAYDGLYEEYGPLFGCLRGKKWVLEPHAIEIQGGLANLFFTSRGVAAVITFGNVAVDVVIRLPGLAGAGVGRVVLLGGKTLEAPCAPHSDSKGVGVRCPAVRLLRGCGVLLLLNESRTSRKPAIKTEDAASAGFDVAFGRPERVGSCNFTHYWFPAGSMELSGDDGSATIVQRIQQAPDGGHCPPKAHPDWPCSAVRMSNSRGASWHAAPARWPGPLLPESPLNSKRAAARNFSSIYALECVNASCAGKIAQWTTVDASGDPALKLRQYLPLSVRGVPSDLQLGVDVLPVMLRDGSILLALYVSRRNLAAGSPHQTLCF